MNIVLTVSYTLRYAYVSSHGKGSLDVRGRGRIRRFPR